MRKMGLALALMAAMASSATAGKRETVMHKFAEVVATATLCPELEMNSVALAVASKAYGIKIYSGTADFDELNRLALEQTDSMSSLSQEAVCTAGRYLYGPNGVSVRGLLLEK